MKTRNGGEFLPPWDDIEQRATAETPARRRAERSPWPQSAPAGPRLVGRLGLKDLHFHDLRHDAASTLTMAGVPQRTVMAILGHRRTRG